MLIKKRFFLKRLFCGHEYGEMVRVHGRDEKGYPPYIILALKQCKKCGNLIFLRGFKVTSY